MIYTSYFAKLNKLPKNVFPVAICGKVPDWYTGARYTKLAPKYYLLLNWKYNHNDDEYAKRFCSTTLAHLDIDRVLTDLQMLMPDDIIRQMQSPVVRNPDWHIALICYEKPSDFCHRHLVRNWIKGHGYECKEFGGEA